jgi:murein DD-endopeptidase MepM/ murein hydrolase activator NlpD
MITRRLKFGFKFGLLILLSAVAIALTTINVGQSSAAVQMGVFPTKPQLGDTLAVFIQTENNAPMAAAPSVVMDKKSFTAFQIAPNLWRSLIPTTPLDRPGDRMIQVAIDGKAQNVPVKVANRKFPTQNIWFDAKTNSLKPSDYELSRVAQFKQLVTPQKFWQGAFLKPNEGAISSGFGIRRYYNGVFANDYYHRGVDYAGDVGSAVVAPAAGQVRLVGTVKQGFRIHGNCVGIDHGQGVASIFLHLNRINVKEGDFVQAGQVVGGVGSTGAATGPHLHWGLYVSGLSVDPTPWRFKGFD